MMEKAYCPLSDGRTVLQSRRECIICGNPDVCLHHVFYGRNRQTADKDKMTVWLCPEHHTGYTGVHNNHELDIRLKVYAQLFWELYYGTREEFIGRYGKSYV